MKLDKKVVRELMVKPGQSADLARRSTSHTSEEWVKALGHTYPKEVAQRDLEGFKEELQRAQELLYASDTWAVLLIFQALDAAGKDGTIKHVMSGVNPQGCQVVSFKEPSAEELRHDFFWRCVTKMPERGHIGIFNRSYYEEVLVTRVHPELLEAEHLPSGSKAGSKLWEDRYQAINDLERHLDRNGTRVVKFFLHVSKEEQRRRFLARLDDPAKRWKFSVGDLAERKHFDEYQAAYEDALTATSTPWAPWFVVPADHKPAMRALVGAVVVDAIDSLSLSYPKVDAEQQRVLDEARAALQAESGAG
ncbi:MAG TPA: polyphosphate kinase 2 family protein [Acidimicrobiales bacterium]|nr:polyphosphate kinase 2 family protein [Acidimicrobiales bacterium]